MIMMYVLYICEWSCGTRSKWNINNRCKHRSADIVLFNMAIELNTYRGTYESDE